MAKRRRKASIETRIKRVVIASLPVAFGVSAVALAVRYFGDKPIINEVANGLQGNVKGSGGLFGWFS